MLETSKKLAFKVRELDFSCILCVYKSRSGAWRGFAHPYDVTIEAPTKGKALSALKEMVEEYEAGLKKYNYPEHLAKKHLSDSEDDMRFNALSIDVIARQKYVDGVDYHIEAKAIPA